MISVSRGAIVAAIAAATVAGGTVVLSVGGRSNGNAGTVQVGAPTPVGVSCTGTPLNAGADVNAAVSAASPGDVVCLNAGSWSAITLTSITPASPGVTLAATPGQNVVVPGFTITGTGTQNLTIEGFNITTAATAQTQGGVPDNGFQLLCSITGNVTLEYNTVENQTDGNGFYVNANNCGAGHTQSGVVIKYNQIDHVGTGFEIDGGTTAEQNFTISHNVIGPFLLDGTSGAPYHTERGHYIQVQGITGLTVANNAFEGPPDPATLNCQADGSQSHLNVLHVDNGESNVTIDSNIIWHTQDCGDTILIQNSPLDNVAITNNLDVEDPGCNNNTANGCQAEFALVEAPHGLTVETDTVVNPAIGDTFGQVAAGDSTYTDPKNMTADHNIAAPTSGKTGESNYDSWNCSATCSTLDNASADTSANTILGGSGNVVSWSASWLTTTWTPVSGSGYSAPPPGYYQPTGLGITGAGYQGSIGP